MRFEQCGLTERLANTEAHAFRNIAFYASLTVLYAGTGGMRFHRVIDARRLAILKSVFLSPQLEQPQMATDERSSSNANSQQMSKTLSGLVQPTSTPLTYKSRQPSIKSDPGLVTHFSRQDDEELYELFVGGDRPAPPSDPKKR